MAASSFLTWILSYNFCSKEAQKNQTEESETGYQDAFLEYQNKYVPVLMWLFDGSIIRLAH